MRGAPWMNRKLTPSGRAAAFLRRELEAFPAIEGREPNGADLDGIVKRTIDTMVPIFKRERPTDYAYDVLEERRQARIKAQAENRPLDRPDASIVKVSGGDRLLLSLAQRPATSISARGSGPLRPMTATI